MEDVKYIQELEKDERDFSFDRDKLLTVLKKQSLWILFLLMACIFSSYLVIRYTKPLYESGSVLKLDIKRDASLLGLGAYDEEQNFNNLSSEIELLKSRLFFNKILDAIQLDVSIYTIGNFLVDERYNNEPFIVQCEVLNNGVYDIPLSVKIIDKDRYNLAFSKYQTEYDKTHSFGESIETPFFKGRILLHPDFDNDKNNNEFYFVFNSRKSLLKYIEENLKIEPLNLNANSIGISFKDYNRIKARDIVNAIDTIYLRYTKEEKNLANTQKINFLNEQLNNTENRLEDFENYFENFIIDNKTIDLSANLSSTITQIDFIDSNSYHLEIHLKRLYSIRDDLDSDTLINLGIIDYRFLPPLIVKEIEKYNEIKERSLSLLTSYNSNTQAYRITSNELGQLYNRIETFIVDYISDVENQINILKRKKSILERDFITLPSKNTEYSKSQRYYTLYEEFYLSLMQKKAEFQLAMAGTVTDFKILSPAYLPIEPLSPKKNIIYGIGAISWLTIVFIMIGVGYLSFNKITGINELEGNTSIPILGTLPFYYKEKLKISKMIIEEDSHSAISEAFRSIRTNMKFVLPSEKGVVVAVSSTVSGEGKTFVGLNLGAVYALSGKKVLLVDMDMRKPRINQVFKTGTSESGMSTLLIGKGEIGESIHHTEMSNLDILASGPIPPNPSELIMSEEMDKILAKLKKDYDLIILDTPPSGIVTDGILVMKKADLQIFVMRAEYSKTQFIGYLQKLQEIHNFSHLYIILNSIKNSKGVHYGYGYGSGYYKEKPASWLKRLLG